MSEASVQLHGLMNKMRCVDLAPLLERGIPTWPTHPKFIIDPTVTHERDGYYCQSLLMAEHTGCHCDAPSHVMAGMSDRTVDAFAANHLFALARIYDFSDRDWKPGETLTSAEVEDYEARHDIRVGAGEIAVVNFGWMKKHWHTDSRAHFYARNAPGMDESVAILFKDRGVRAVGADTIACDIPVVDGVSGDAPGHRRHWLPNNILIIECMARLEQLPRTCFIAATPLPISKGSGSPLRPLAFF